MSPDTRWSRDVCACFAYFFSFPCSPYFLKSEVDKHAFLRTKDLGSERFSRMGNYPRRYPPTPDLEPGMSVLFSVFRFPQELRAKVFGGCMESREPFLGTTPLCIDSSVGNR